MIRRAAMTLAALFAAGCTWREPPSIAVASVNPASTTRGVMTMVTVTGEGFEPSVFVDFDDPESSSVCGGYRVELRAAGRTPVALSDARIVSSTEVRGRIIGDVGKALWDVVVIDPEGLEAALTGALDVLNCSPPNTPCDDLEPCTFDADLGDSDRCNGSSFCEGMSHLPDDTSCAFACAAGGAVPGTCRAGVCVPAAGQCEPPPACTP